MRLWLRALFGFGLPRRQAAQNLVEFGLIVAAVSILGVAGLQVLGRAEENYFIPLASNLAPRAPQGSDDVVHPTTVTITCAPTTVVVLLSTTCSFTVRDAWTTKRTWPQGTIHLLVDTLDTGTSCALAQDTSGGDSAFSKCSLQWWPAAANAPSATLTAHFVPSDGTHASPQSDPSQTVAVEQRVNVAFTPPAGQTTSCWNPAIVIAGQPETVEIGHPILCHLTVTDPLGNVVSNTPVNVTEAVVPSDSGLAFFSCFTNSNRSLYTQCNAAAPTFTGNTDATGQLTFVYRRYYDALVSAVRDTFTATATAYTNSTATHQIKIVRPTAGPHATDMVVHCDSDVNGSVSWVANSGLSVRSDTAMQGRNNELVTCRAVVFDVDPTNVYISDNLDTEDAFAPSGWVYWVDEHGQQVLDQAGQPAACAMSMGNPLGTYLPYQVHGLPNYASTCSVTFKFSGDHTITAHYDGEPGPNPAHKPAASRQISLDFD